MQQSVPTKQVLQPVALITTDNNDSNNNSSNNNDSSNNNNSSNDNNKHFYCYLSIVILYIQQKLYSPMMK